MIKRFTNSLEARGKSLNEREALLIYLCFMVGFVTLVGMIALVLHFGGLISWSEAGVITTLGVLVVAMVEGNPLN